MPATYFLGNRLLATGTPLNWGGSVIPGPCGRNLAFFCPSCGEVWARVVDSSASGWHSVTRGCAQHPRSGADDSAGSFIHPWIQHGLPELPDAVLEYEMQLRLTRFSDDPRPLG